MNIVKTIEQYNENYVFLCDPIKNNVMNDSSFIRIIYSTPNVILNGIYILFTLNNITCDKYYAKYRCWFNYDDHIDVITKFNKIEDGILKNANILHKTPQYKLYDQFKTGNIKVFSDVTNNTSCLFVLKISGIWETKHSYGLTYKFVQVKPLF